jgi:hypothetical protein
VHLGPLAGLPDWYWDVRYAGERFPGAVPRGKLDDGANCQLWAYEVLDHFGLAVPDYRSDELVGVWTGDAVAHLCAEVGRPAVWPQAEFDARPLYAVRIGFKRPTRRLP